MNLAVNSPLFYFNPRFTYGVLLPSRTCNYPYFLGSRDQIVSFVGGSFANGFQFWGECDWKQKDYFVSPICRML